MDPQRSGARSPVIQSIAALALALVAPARAADAPGPSFAEDFEGPMTRWRKGDPGAQPLLIVSDRAYSGKRSAYSGPPGRRRVSRTDFALPLVGRLEVRFYDDLAPAKHQMAIAVGLPRQILGIACRGGRRYQARVGQTYTTVAVARSKGWHRFAWECDGRQTIAFIDGKRVFANETLGRIHGLVLGSFWDASTGWYDDVRAYARPPAFVGPFVDAEEALRQDGGTAQLAELPQASGRAVTRWGKAGHALEWMIGSTLRGQAMLLVKYANAGKDATCAVELGAKTAVLRLPGTGGPAKWGYASLAVEAPGERASLRMVSPGGSVNLDWIALVAPAADPQRYGKLLDQWARSAATDPWHAAAVAQTRAAAKAAGVEGLPDALDPRRVATLPSEGELKTLATSITNGLAAARQRVLDAERPKLKGIYQPRRHKPLGEQTPLSRECYRRLLRYVRLTQPQMRDWPHAPGCRYHKSDVHGEQAVRQNATVALGYSVLLTGDYDEKLAGVPREVIERDLVALLRYVAITHRANFVPTGDGRPWGDQWQSALWAHWAGHAAWLAWDRLDDGLKVMLARLIVHEANRFNLRPPDSGEWRDTKAEENAWNSMIIALAECMFPHHPNAKLWRERAIVYLLNSFTRESDRKETRTVDGRPVKERVTAVTVHPDFTLENHGRVHPDYLGCFGLMLRSAILYHGAGVEPPQSLFYNVREAAAVLRRLTATNGSYFYVNGQDWWPHRHDSPLTVSGLTSVLLGDRDAAFIERSTLDFFGRMHARFDDGRAWHPREYNYRNAEEEMIARYGELCLLHRLLGDGPEPATREEFLQRQSGTHVYDIGGFVTHRTPEKFVSFAWVNGAMGLVYPSDDTWFTSPSERGMVGRIVCQGAADTRPKVLGRRVVTRKDGFSLAARISRCGGEVVQFVAVFSLPGAPVVYLERLVAREAVTVKEVATGTAAILNEDAPGISPNRRMLVHAGGKQQILGLSDAAPRRLTWKSHWANVDDRFGVLSTTGSMAWRDNNAYRRSRLEEELVANYRPAVGRVPAGEEIGACAVAFLPNLSAADTAKLKLELASEGDALIAARLGRHTVAANLGTHPAQGELFGRKLSLEPLGTATQDEAAPDPAGE